MKSIDLELLIKQRNQDLFEKYPYLIKNLTIKLLKKILHIDKINQFLNLNQYIKNFEFIDSLFDYLEFSYTMSERSKKRIPSEGKLVIVSNHPLGGLDGLALLKAVSEVRKDVKIVANDILLNIDNLRELFLAYDLFSHSSQKNNIKAIENALNNDEAVIFFPAGEVSRMNPNGIKDKKWKKGPISFAIKMQAPILPAFIEARNSFAFYFASLLYNPLGMLLLPHELFNKKGKSINIRFGDLIPNSAFSATKLSAKVNTNILRKHTFNIGKQKAGLFPTEETIVHPIAPRQLKKELSNSTLIGKTSDDKKIYLVESANCPNIIKEIGRLRELTFRKVGEGTGRSIDNDVFDNYYKHIVLWDEENLDVVGSYRMGISSDIIKVYGKEGLYNSGQFQLNQSFDKVLLNSVEMGRSFVQQKYWKTNALDYMWQGIGAFLKDSPDIKYLWGAVSISDAYSNYAKSIIVYYYKKWFSGPSSYANAYRNFSLTKTIEEELAFMFNGDNKDEDFKIMKNALKNLGYSVPVLFRRYTEICEFGGVSFVDFSIDEKFSNSVDGFILVDLSMMKEEYKDRYLGLKSIKI